MVKRVPTLLIVVGALACMPPGSGETEASSNGNEQGDGDGDPEPVCGDGKIEAPEVCDDGNTEPGDGCTATCLASGTPTQCFTLVHGEGTSIDSVEVILPYTDSLVAGGTLRVEGEDVAWVGKWSDEGEQRWLTMASEDSYLRDLTTDGSSGHWAALTASSVAELVHLDDAGHVLERTPVPDAFVRRVRWIDGRLWVAGTFEQDLWLAVRVDGNLETLLLEDHLGFEDTIGAMEVHGDRVLVAATLATDDGFDGDILLTPTAEIVVIAFDLDGNELEREAVDVGSLETPYASALVGVDDRWVVAGHAPPQQVLHRQQIWLTSAAQDWAWNSISVFGPQQGSMFQGGADVGGLAKVGSGFLLAGLSATYPGPTNAVELTGWLVEFDSAGQMVWDYHVTHPDEAQYQETAVVIDAEGRIRTAGLGWTDGRSSTLRTCIVER